jgi:hypothetical protein
MSCQNLKDVTNKSQDKGKNNVSEAKHLAATSLIPFRTQRLLSKTGLKSAKISK